MAANGTTAFVTGAGRFCRWLRLLFGLQLLSCLTAPVQALEEGGPRPVVHLVWIDVSQIAGFAFEPMSADVDSLLGKVGVDAAWTRAEPRTAVTADTFSVIVLGSKARRPERRRPVMGSIMAGPSPPPTVWIYLPAVLGALGLQERASLTLFEKGDIGRALARVIVHELVHVVLPGRPHSRSGLMAAQLGRNVLLWPGAEIEPTLAAPLLAGLAVWPLRLDVPKAGGGTLDGAATRTCMNLKPSEQEDPSSRQ